MKQQTVASAVVLVYLEVALSPYIASAGVDNNYYCKALFPGATDQDLKTRRWAGTLLRDYTYRFAAGNECASHGIVFVHFSPLVRQFSQGRSSSHLILLSRHESQARATFLLFPLAPFGGVMDVVGRTGLI